MALNKHMAAAVAEIDADIERMRIESRSVMARQGAEFKRLKAARDDHTIDSSIARAGTGEAGETKVKISLRSTACLAAAMPEPLTAVLLAWAAVCSNGAASKCLKRWLAEAG